MCVRYVYRWLDVIWNDGMVPLRWCKKFLQTQKEPHTKAYCRMPPLTWRKKHLSVCLFMLELDSLYKRKTKTTYHRQDQTCLFTLLCRWMKKHGTEDRNVSVNWKEYVTCWCLDAGSGFHVTAARRSATLFCLSRLPKVFNYAAWLFLCKVALSRRKDGGFVFVNFRSVDLMTPRFQSRTKHGRTHESSRLRIAFELTFTCLTACLKFYWPRLPEFSLILFKSHN